MTIEDFGNMTQIRLLCHALNASEIEAVQEGENRLLLTDFCTAGIEVWLKLDEPERDDLIAPIEFGELLRGTALHLLAEELHVNDRKRLKHRVMLTLYEKGFWLPGQPPPCEKWEEVIL